MLRNLLYSFFFHVLFIALLVLSTIEIDTKIIRNDITPLTISFLNDNIIDEIKERRKESEKVKGLSIDEKINLYNKVKKTKKTTSATKENKTIYEKSDKKPLPVANAKTLTENEFSYHYTPIYVAEDKINTDEKRKLIENRIKREELRKKMKERNIIPAPSIADMIQTQSLQNLIKVSQKPLVVDKKSEKSAESNEAPVVEEDIKVAVNNKEATSDLNKLIDELTIEENIIDEKFKGVKEDEIFNDEDYKKLKEINENKEDTKYALSLREKRNIQRQIKGCYKMAILRSKKDSKAIISLTTKIESDGIIDMNSIKVNRVVDSYEKNGYEVALENAKSALVFCSPLRGLPAGKYKAWKQMTFVFDSNNLE